MNLVEFSFDVIETVRDFELMKTLAVVMEKPQHLALDQIALEPMTDADVLVDVQWSGISTGTERLLFNGEMPPFPGLKYPLVPGYEAVGRVVQAGRASGRREGDSVFVPGARCYGDIQGLFGGAAQQIVVPGARTTTVDGALGADATLLALAATAYHALCADDAVMPDLIIGHGALGRLIARIAIALGADAPVVWETNAARRAGAHGYDVVDPSESGEQRFASIYDVSGDAELLDRLIGILQPGGAITLAGFYSQRLSFAFPPAFMREMRLRVAAEWKPQDLENVLALIEGGKLSLDGLITDKRNALCAVEAYETAFHDPSCLKMILDWSSQS